MTINLFKQKYTFTICSCELQFLYLKKLRQMVKPINFEEILITIGDNIHTIRSSKKETLETTSSAIGIKHPSLSKIENGRYPGLTVDLLIKICNHFKVPLQQILGLEVLQIFNLSQNAENGSSGAPFKQVINEVAEGYAKALDQANSEIEYLRLLLKAK